MGTDGRAVDEVLEVKKENGNESSSKDEVKSETQDVKDKEKEKPQYCRDCRFYDHSTEREFKRNGIREGLVETRAICRNPKARSHNHIVMAELNRPKKRRCEVWEAGVYKPPERPKKKEQKTQKTESKDEEKTSPSEYHGPPLTDLEKTELKQNKKKRSEKQLLKNGEKVTVANSQNGEVKTFAQKGHRLVLVGQ